MIADMAGYLDHHRVGHGGGIDRLIQIGTGDMRRREGMSRCNSFRDRQHEVPAIGRGHVQSGEGNVLLIYGKGAGHQAAGLKPEQAEVTLRAENSIELAGHDAEKMQRLIDMLEDLDDVQAVFHNAVIQI